MKKAIVLISGGLHSTTALAIAASRNYEIYALSFDFGAKTAHKVEAAKRAAEKYGVKEHKIIKLDIHSLLGLAEDEAITSQQIPARNNLYLSFALSWAELLKVGNLFVGVNSIEYGDNPDCRPSFIHTFEKLANVAVKKGAGMRKIDVWSPLMNSATSDTILRGTELGVDYSDTYSCQDLDEAGAACGECESCEIRKEGFAEAGISDPAAYRD